MGGWASAGTRAETLGRGCLARLMYDLGHEQATGFLRVSQHGRSLDLLAVRRGRLLCAPSDPIGRLGRRRLANLASRPDVQVEFDSTARAHPPGGSHAFCLAGWARQHFESQLDARRASELVSSLGTALLRVPANRIPAPRILDATDVRILDALRSPVRFDQIGPRARAPRFRLIAFLHFLRRVGALHVAGAATRPPPRQPETARPTDALRTLGVEPGTAPEELKRVYRRLVRSLHPDLHPSADDSQRRALERRLAEVNRAYRELLP